MRLILFFSILLLPLSLTAQNYKSMWSEAIQDELNGKTESAYKKVQNIYAVAKTGNDEEQIIKCFFYISKFRQVFEEKAPENIISNLREEISIAKPTSKAILNYIYGVVLNDYYNYHSYKINTTTFVEDKLSADINTWSKSNFKNEIARSFQAALTDIELLSEIPIDNFKEILEIPSFVDGKNYSLYDLLLQEISKQYFKIINTQEINEKLVASNQEIKNFYASTNDFLNIKDDNYTIEFNSFLAILQQKEKMALQTHPSQIDKTRYQRLLLIHSLFHKTLLLENSITEIHNTTCDKDLYYEISLRKTKNLIEANSKEENANSKVEALQLLEKIIQENPNEYVTTEAQLQKETILDKYLEITLNKVNYEGENTRAFVAFKNVDSLRVKYYKIEAKDVYLFDNYDPNQEQTLSKYLENKKSFLETLKGLPNPKNHYQYTTEILMDKLPLGYYIVTFEDNDKNSNTTLQRSYGVCHITNISYVKDESVTDELFYVMHRKTGKPLKDVTFLNDSKKFKTDSNGKMIYPKPRNGKRVLSSVSYFIYQKDTLVFNFDPKIKDKHVDDDDESFEAQAKIYLDRAIYRPGQKVYFKGIMVQNKNKIKSVVPYVTAHITIEDASYNTIKELDLQTNEFGSFSGEFDLPKNCVTGEFSIDIEEPDNEFLSKDKKYYNKKEKEHSFWENVDLRNDTFHFKVEEYKRPTFEITVDKIKETYSIGDLTTIKGHAKNLAGNNLTNSRVKYTISRNYQTSNNTYYNDANYIQRETTTSNEGSFTIPLATTIQKFKSDELKEITFTIEIEITDTNGETRSLTKTVAVKKEMLQLGVASMTPYFIEKENTLSITISNLDNTPIPYPGKIEFYQKERTDHLKRRIFPEPELQNIKNNDFVKLFPFEPSPEKKKNNLELVKTIDFDTKITNEVTLPKLEKGNYKALVAIADTKGNTISQERHFTIQSKENPLAEDKLFAYKRINKEDPNFIHFELSTNVSELYITTRFYYGNEINSEQITLLTNGKGMVSFKKTKETKYDYAFFFSTQWENTSTSENITLRKEDVTQNLNFEVVSFRNKIEPGSNENWSFKIVDHKQEAEVLASMYDSSLDQFAKDDWQKPEFYNYARVPFPRIDNYNTQEINFYSRTQKIYYKRLNFAPKFEWFGFNYNDSKSLYIQKQYEEKVARPQIIRNGSKLITGVVADANGPIPGANVVVKGTTIGVSTGFDGKYSIYALEGDQLVFEFMGMHEVIKTVGSSNTINTVLQDESKKLNEVVVTALGIRKEKGTFNPNILVVTSNDKDLSYFFKYRRQLFHKWDEDEEDIVKTKKASLSYSVRTIEERVVIRGSTSVTNNNNALIIIDGIPQENISGNTINPDDITEITILKDSAATALYGSKGANGVIIITTKNAIKELSQVKTRTNFNETAFFYPHLTTDSSGKIAFNFTTPESLTKWKLRLFGHTKNADIGTFETEIISQKDLMVMPNMPRFLRETDTITLSAKVVNLTQDVKSGNAVLQLFDAVTGNPIDTVCLNTNNLKPFTSKAKESNTIDWKITIPEGIQGIQYKVIAKSGAFSDGEENILPVLSNKILITEAMPVWVRENSKKEFVLEHLKNNTSKTLKNQSFTFEYTSNHTWLAIQSLPYVMEFEHECAEQTFARFYANALASKIIDSQPKVVAVFEKWRNNPNHKSTLEMNEELKSIVLRETPWLLEADETENNKRIAALLDLQKLQIAKETTLDKLEAKQLSSGGFPWFDGGRENYNVTQHILSGLGHLQKMVQGLDVTKIINKGIPFIDQQFISNTQNQRKYKSTITTTELQYLYCRSFYAKTHPMVNDSLKKALDYQIQQVKINWLQLDLPQKAMLALALNRLGDSTFAQKIITHLKETAIKNSETGMYWLSNKNGYGWFDAAIENQALLIEAFAEIDNDPTILNNLKVWLINQKQRESWGTTKATTEAIYALLFQGTSFLDQKIENSFTIGNPQLLKAKLTSAKTESESGYFKIQWKPEEVTKELATITIENKSGVPSFGGVYWQYFEDLESITASANKALNIQKEVYKKVKASNGNTLIPLQNEAIHVGDIITTRLIIKADTNLEFVHLKDLRASCFEPIDVLSEYEFKNDISYYRSTKDTATHFFFDTVKKGTYILEYDVRVNNTGVFNNGIATLQSMYAPEFSAHSRSQKINVISK